jgi:hypothetical protein
VSVVGVVVLALAFSSPAFGRTFKVTRDDDPVPSADLCPQGDCSLRGAVLAADGRQGADTIEFARRLSGETIQLSQGDVRIRRDLLIDGPGSGDLAISANQQSRVFHMTGGDVTIRGITIRDGRETATADGPRCPGTSAPVFTLGGGILQDEGRLELEGVKLKDNAVSAAGGIVGGGGIANVDGRLSVINSRLVDNAALGGAISNGGGILNCVGVVKLKGSTVRDSAVSATGIGDGGGIANGQGAAHSEGELTLKKTTVASNNVSSEAISSGGGVGTTGGPVEIERSTIADNSATVSGGGSISSAGGLSNANSKVTVTNSTIANNLAIAPNASGGGIRVGGFEPKLVLRSSTVARNTADGSNNSTGGNLLGAGFAKVRNTIVAKGTAETGSNCDAPVKSSGHDLEDENTCGFDDRSDRVNRKPRLRDLAENGGPTETIALKRRSPAIDHAGKNSPERDQRGFRRDGKPDIGAYEFGAKP